MRLIRWFALTTLVAAQSWPYTRFNSTLFSRNIFSYEIAARIFDRYCPGRLVRSFGILVRSPPVTS